MARVQREKEQRWGERKQNAPCSGGDERGWERTRLNVGTAAAVEVLSPTPHPPPPPTTPPHLPPLLSSLSLSLIAAIPWRGSCIRRSRLNPYLLLPSSPKAGQWHSGGPRGKLESA